MKIRPGRHADLAAVTRLLDVAGLPDRDIGDHFATLFVGEQGGAIVATGALEPLGTDCLLRSVAVVPGSQGRGWGRRMTMQLLDFARAIGVGHAYLLTTGAAGYFASRGFAVVPRESAPELVRRSRQFSQLCPSTAILMCARLDAGGDSPGAAGNANTNSQPR
jgi:N-acetylglutamate synthase-like GNAT family acetyltransferase